MGTPGRPEHVITDPGRAALAGGSACHGKLADGLGIPIEPHGASMGMERSHRREQGLKRIVPHTGHIPERRWADLHVDEASTG
jgi:hypothetical protein